MRARAFHRAFEQVGGFGRDANTLVDVLIACILKSFLNQHLDRARVERQIAHRRVEEVGLFGRDCVENMFHCDVILVTAARILNRMLEDALPALRETVFISSQIDHYLSLRAKRDANPYRLFATLQKNFS